MYNLKDNGEDCRSQVVVHLETGEIAMHLIMRSSLPLEKWLHTCGKRVGLVHSALFRAYSQPSQPFCQFAYISVYNYAIIVYNIFIQSYDPGLLKKTIYNSSIFTSVAIA
jgi:hypothetical protein